MTSPGLTTSKKDLISKRPSIKSRKRGDNTDPRRDEISVNSNYKIPIGQSEPKTEIKRKGARKILTGSTKLNNDGMIMRSFDGIQKDSSRDSHNDVSPTIFTINRTLDQIEK